jgi:hypothetical protein
MAAAELACLLAAAAALAALVATCWALWATLAALATTLAALAAVLAAFVAAWTSACNWLSAGYRLAEDCTMVAVDEALVATLLAELAACANEPAVCPALVACDCAVAATLATLSTALVALLARLPIVEAAL